jgi:hypothetical protein
MANTVTATTLVNGQRNLIQVINIVGDGSGEESASVLVDRSTFTPDGTELVVEKIEGLLTGFSASLLFDATDDLVFARLPDGDWFCHDWEKIGGVSSNKAGAGATGDILLTTSSLGNGDAATFYLHMRKA